MRQVFDCIRRFPDRFSIRTKHHKGSAQNTFSGKEEKMQETPRLLFNERTSRFKESLEKTCHCNFLHQTESKSRERAMHSNCVTQWTKWNSRRLSLGLVLHWTTIYLHKQEQFSFLTLLLFLALCKSGKIGARTLLL